MYPDMITYILAVTMAVTAGAITYKLCMGHAVLHNTVYCMHALCTSITFSNIRMHKALKHWTLATECKGVRHMLHQALPI